MTVTVSSNQNGEGKKSLDVIEQVVLVGPERMMGHKKAENRKES